MTTSTVATPSAQHNKMVQAAEQVRALVAGTPAMRAAREKYLPKAEAESQDAYNARLLRSVLFNATGKTVQDMTGKIFVKPVVLEKDVPAELVAMAENIDLTGRHLNVFAKDVFEDALQPGVGYIYVDMPPPVVRADGAPATIADEQALRPYLTYIPMERLIGWKSETIGGVETLTQIRIKECVSEPDGEFLEKEVEQIRVVTPGAWQTFRKGLGTDKDTWVPHESGTIVGPKQIPIVPVYVNRSEFMQGKPPLAKIAELNVAHWQLDSDITAIMHVASVPILYMAGFGEGDQIKIGASEAIRASSPDATVAYVEHTGAAIGKAMERLAALESSMQTMGLQLMTPKPGVKTATGEIRDDAKENSPLAMMARGLQDALEQAFGYMAEFKGKEFKPKKDGGGSIRVNQDFGVQSGSIAVADVVSVEASGLVSKETAWEQLQRIGFLPDSFDVAVEKSRLAEQPPDVVAAPGKGLDLGA